jgi:beta-phosphoglucomutase-like phosphatase (HAD superfamily)
MAIVTNNSVAEQIEKLSALDIARYFDTIVISEDVGVIKPDPKIFAFALERLGAKAHEAVMVGDSLANDIAGAINAGIAPVWLNRKAHETPVSTGFNRQKIVGTAAKSGLSIHEIITIRTLAPVTTALAAIETAFSKHSLGMKETPNAKLATLAS